MKKRVLSMLMVMIMMVSMLSVSVFAEDCEHDWVDNGTKAVCSKCADVHEHTYASAQWSYDDDNHWKLCANCPVDAEEQYNLTAHNFVENDDAFTTDKVELLCECGAASYVHAHVWDTEYSYDEDGHWTKCLSSGCDITDVTEMQGYGAHKLSTSGTVKSCSVCDYEEHVHSWSSTRSKDSDYHWYACKDSSCDEVKSYEAHYDHNSSGTCDVCGAKISEVVLYSLTVNGLTEPSDGEKVDFSVSVDEERFGTPVVKWNRVVDLSKNTSVAMTKNNTYAAGYMYNTSILVPMNSCDEISDDIEITLDGVQVPYYTTDAAYQAALNSFEGRYAVYAAKAMWTNDYLCICISVQYPTTAGTHTHDYGDGWLATPAKHYLKCIGCGEVPEAEYHADSDSSGFCDECNYNMNYYDPNATTYEDGTTSGTTTTTHTHTYSADWVEDYTYHWKQCTGCGAKTQTAAHADLNSTGLCDVCGFVMTAADGHTHSYSTEWTETFAQHYKVCSCGAKTEIAAHADLNNTGKCDTCGYAMTTLSNNGIVADTGDSNAVFLWMAAFAVSVLGVGATVLFVRKKREE